MITSNLIDAPQYRPCFGPDLLQASAVGTPRPLIINKIDLRAQNFLFSLNGFCLEIDALDIPLQVGFTYLRTLSVLWITPPENEAARAAGWTVAALLHARGFAPTIKNAAKRRPRND